MNDQNKIMLANQAQNHEVNPPTNAWNKLENRLKNNSNSVTSTSIFKIKNIYKILAAASIASIILISIIVTNYQSKESQATYAMDTVTQSDDLSFQNDRNIYQINQLNTLREAYKKLSDKY